jgi:Flp pilus assembly protein TadG
MIKRLRSQGQRDSRGQILVIFALALVAITAMVGLVLDGGSAFAQRRSEQNAADLAALAAANDLIVNQGSADWLGTAHAIARLNGYEDGKNGATVTVTCQNCPGQALDAAYDGVQVRVDISGKHANAFVGVVGMTSWDVSVTATSKTGWPDSAAGPAPFIVSKKAFDDVGKATSCTGPSDQCDLGHPVDDTPSEATEFTWTDFGVGTGGYEKPCLDTGNVNDAELANYMDGQAKFSLTLQFGCYIAQHNDGVMNNIVAQLHALAPIELPVPIVDEEGKFVGWATFHLTKATAGGRNGILTGYFLSGLQNQRLDVKSPGFGSAIFGGTYQLKLIN